MSENHSLNFLKDGHFQKRKSSQKNFRNFIIPIGKSFFKIFKRKS